MRRDQRGAHALAEPGRQSSRRRPAAALGADRRVEDHAARATRLAATTRAGADGAGDERARRRQPPPSHLGDGDADDGEDADVRAPSPPAARRRRRSRAPASSARVGRRRPEHEGDAGEHGADAPGRAPTRRWRSGRPARRGRRGGRRRPARRRRRRAGGRWRRRRGPRPRRRRSTPPPAPTARAPAAAASRGTGRRGSSPARSGRRRGSVLKIWWSSASGSTSAAHHPMSGSQVEPLGHHPGGGELAAGVGPRADPDVAERADGDGGGDDERAPRRPGAHRWRDASAQVVHGEGGRLRRSSAAVAPRRARRSRPASSAVGGSPIRTDDAHAALAGPPGDVGGVVEADVALGREEACVEDAGPGVLRAGTGSSR